MPLSFLSTDFELKLKLKKNEITLFDNDRILLFKDNVRTDKLYYILNFVQTPHLLLRQATQAFVICKKAYGEKRTSAFTSCFDAC